MKDLTREQLEAFYADSLSINATLRGENERLKKHVNDCAQTIESLKANQSLIVPDEKDPNRIAACVNACAGLHTKIIQTIAAFCGMSQDNAVSAVLRERDAFVAWANDACALFTRIAQSEEALINNDVKHIIDSELMYDIADFVEYKTPQICLRDVKAQVVNDTAIYICDHAFKECIAYKSDIITCASEYAATVRKG